MDVFSDWKAWVVAVAIVVLPVSWVGHERYGWFVPTLDNPVGTLRFEELSTALATDPDRVVDRLVGHVWGFEGPKRTYEGYAGGVFFFVDLGTKDGFDDRLYLTFATRSDRSQFETDEVAIACLVTSANVDLVAPTSPDNDERSIAAKSCRVVEPDTNPASDPP